MSDRSFLFVLGSSRSDGNTEMLARAAAEQLPAGVRQRWVDLAGAALPDFQDGRHEAEGWMPSASEEALRLATLEATDVVIASPLYWYALSAHTKRYLDYWSGWLTTPGSDFKQRMAGRTLWGVTAMADPDEVRAEGLVTSLHHTAAYLRMGFGGVLLGNGSRPGQVRDDERAMVRAKTFFAQDAPWPASRRGPALRGSARGGPGDEAGAAPAAVPGVGLNGVPVALLADEVERTLRCAGFGAGRPADGHAGPSAVRGEEHQPLGAGAERAGGAARQQGEGAGHDLHRGTVQGQGTAALYDGEQDVHLGFPVYGDLCAGQHAHQIRVELSALVP